MDPFELIILRFRTWFDDIIRDPKVSVDRKIELMGAYEKLFEITSEVLEEYKNDPAVLASTRRIIYENEKIPLDETLHARMNIYGTDVEKEEIGRMSQVTFKFGEKVHLSPLMQIMVDHGKVRKYTFGGYASPWTKKWSVVERRFRSLIVETSELRKIQEYDFQI